MISSQTFLEKHPNDDINPRKLLIHKTDIILFGMNNKGLAAEVSTLQLMIQEWYRCAVRINHEQRLKVHEMEIGFLPFDGSLP